MGRKINVNIRFTEITIRSRIRVYCISADHSVEFTNRCIPKWCSCGIIAERKRHLAHLDAWSIDRALEHRRVGYIYIYILFFFIGSTHLPWSIGLLRIYTIRVNSVLSVYLFASFADYYRAIKRWTSLSTVILD